MTKKQIAMIVLIILGIIIVIVGFWPQKKKIVVEEITPTPTKAEPFYSETGAKYVTPKAYEQKEIEQIRELRSKLPMNLDKYEIKYDYSKNKFTVRSNEEINITDFAKMMVENNFGNISKNYFIFE